jgi:hypothetical protein
VTGIDSGGLPPLGPVGGSQNPGQAGQPAPAGPALAADGRAITDQIQQKTTLPLQLQALVDSELTAEGARQGAADISASLRTISLSIANADPTNLPDLGSQ